MLLQKIKQSTRNKKGQVAVIILFFVAVAFVVYAMTLNLSNMTQSKMVTDIASTSGASVLASQMASYGQQLLMSQLGGEYKRCESTGVIAKIAIVVILAIVAIYTFGSGAAAINAGKAVGATAAETAAASKAIAANILATVAVGASAVSLVVNVTVVQPGITGMWNKITSQALGIEDQFVEGGIQAGMGAAIGDGVLVDDLVDFDMDGLFGYVNAIPLDQVSRYAVYYQKVRLENIFLRDIPEVKAFATGLVNFVYQTKADDPDCLTACSTDPTDLEECVYGPDREAVDGVCAPAWGLADILPVSGKLVPAPSDNRLFLLPADKDETHRCHPANLTEGGDLEPSLPSECNPCCVPETVEGLVSTDDEAINFRPDFCDTGVDVSWTASTCAARSPYGMQNPAVGDASSYAYVYDPFYENMENDFFSFRERLGRDDEHRFYSKVPDNPNEIQQSIRPGAGVLPTVYSMRDTTGYYAANPPADPEVPENRKGLYTFLHKIYDADPTVENKWGFDLSTVDPAETGFAQMPACLWCDARLAEASACDLNLLNETRQLQLPVDVQDVSYIIQDQNPCVDETVDRVSLTGSIGIGITGTIGIGIPEDTCAVADLAGQNDVDGFWKPGADRFCNEGDNPANGAPQWPYEDLCPKYIDGGCLDSTGEEPSPCVCGEDGAPPATEWPEDPLDDLVYGLPEFLVEAQRLLGMSETSMSVQFGAWFESWEPFLNPGPNYMLNGVAIPCHARLQRNETGDYDLTCPEEKGRLFVWRDNIAFMLKHLEKLRSESFVGTSCDDVWCVPPVGCSATSQEEAMFDINNDGVRGDIEDIIACLQFNANGYDYTNDVLQATDVFLGNDAAFEACATTCSPEACSTDPLPRSVLPGFDPNADIFVEPDPALEADRLAMLNCLTSCSAQTCDDTLSTTLLPLTAGYTYPDQTVEGAFDEAAQCSPDVWRPGGSVWYDAMVDNLMVAADSNSCDMGAGGWLRQIFLSWQEARNQVQKLNLRRDFLQKRLMELDEAITVLDTALTRFDDFLSKQVKDVIQARIDLDDSTLTDKHPFHMVYGWRDDPRPGQSKGAWHIVKVEARIPQRCGSGACDGDGDGDPPFIKGDVPWPKIETYTKGALSTKRCYELINLDGGVKFRVTRVDQELGAGEARLPSGFRLWKFKKGPPSRDIDPTLWADLGTVCRPQPNPSTALNEDPVYGGAFLLNERTADQNIKDCWDKVHDLLKVGVVSETCAVYYAKEGDRRGFSFDFVPCEANGDRVF